MRVSKASTDGSFARTMEGMMRKIPDPKTMAKALRTSLSQREIDISHSTALEIVALANDSAASKGIRFQRTSPVMRIFDETKAKEFYLGFLGFALDWEHRFGDNFPLYSQVSRAGLTIHLSEHHGDASPGSTAFVNMVGVHAFQRELALKNYPYGKPEIEDLPWGSVMTVTDPFNNRIRFCESKSAA
jgi:hypothetical protein